MAASKRTEELLGFWVGGMNSLVPPHEISKQQYAYAENVLCRGGIPQTRPGLRYVSGLLGANLQGATVFQPLTGLPILVIAVDGVMYRADFPFTDFSPIPGVQMSQAAPIITFQQCLKSVKVGFSGSVTLIDPVRVLIIQDGINNPISWNGEIAREMNPKAPFRQTPKGLWMEWANSRLWVADGSKLFASDLATPESFSEDKYLAERSGFELGETITGMIQTTDLNGLLVFTEKNTFRFQSAIYERTEWQKTANFQSLVLSDIGCVAGRSPVNSRGLTYWMSLNGLVSLNAAMALRVSSTLDTMDGRMARSKVGIGDGYNACSGSIGDLLFFSVPAFDQFNAHTWVRDQAPSGESGEDGDIGAPPSIWSSIWTGIRPAQWVTVTIGGINRCFCVALDRSAKDGKYIHIWEAMHSRRVDDNEIDIQCMFETALVSLPKRKRFSFAEIDLCEILGVVELQIYFGGLKGPWVKVFDSVLRAEEGSIGVVPLKPTVAMRAFKPQSRTVRTANFSPQGKDCPAESNDGLGVDKAAGFLFTWKGRMGIQRIRMFLDDVDESDSGECHKTEEETELALDYQGNEYHIPTVFP